MGINFLHPYFTIAVITLIFISISELRNGAYKPSKLTWLVIAFLIILTGFRNLMIDDLAYQAMYNQFGSTMSFSIKEMKDNIWGVEWMYVLYGKIVYALKLPFAFFVILTAIFTITSKYLFITKNSAYPALSFLLYMFPTFFMGDMGHMRQAIATAIVFISFWTIKERKLWLFLLLMFIAFNFHNSSITFVLAYWLVKVPLKKWMIASLVGISILLSPFEVYSSISLLDSITPQEVMQDYQNYETIVHEDTGKIRLLDLLTLFYLYFILAFNKESEQKIPYYEYMRNLTVAGICLYFIFRNSPVFSTRLVSYYLLFSSITIPNIIAAVSSINLRRYLYLIMICFVVFYYFVFASVGGKRSFTWETYSNWLIGG